MGVSGGISGVVAGSMQPSDQNLLGWAFDPFGLSVAGTQVSGQLYLVKIPLRVAATVTNIIMSISAGGATLTAGQNFAVLYSSAGALLGVTADQSASWASAGLKTMALASPPAVPAGFVYAGMWSVGTTPPTFFHSPNAGNNPINSGLVAPNLRACTTSDAALTTTAPANFGTQTANIIAPWAAIS